MYTPCSVPGGLICPALSLYGIVRYHSLLGKAAFIPLILMEMKKLEDILEYYNNDNYVFFYLENDIVKKIEYGDNIR